MAIFGKSGFFVESAGRDPGLDWLRALAVGLVVFRHFLDRNPAYSPTMPDALEAVGLFGWAGVDLFFVLSGFLIFRGIFERDRIGRPAWIDFLINRALRIWPAYYGSIVVCVLLGIFPVDWGDLTCFWFFLQNYCGPLSALNGGVYWSLAVEEHFYLSAALLMALSRGLAHRRRTLILAAILFAPILRCVIYLLLVDGRMREFYFLIYFPTHTRYDALLVGVLCAHLFVERPAWLDGLAAKLLLPAVAGAALWVALRTTTTLSLYGQQPSLGAAALGFGFVAYFWGAGLLCVVLWRPFRAVGAGPIRWIAQLSYSMYLFHIVALHYANTLFAGAAPTATNAALHASVYVGGTLAASALSYAIFERAFLKLKRRPAGVGAVAPNGRRA